jgi:hypothetical protein
MVSKHNITEFPPAHKLKPLATGRGSALLFFKRCHPERLLPTRDLLLSFGILLTNLRPTI